MRKLLVVASGLCVSLALVCSSVAVSQPPPKREFRAAWVATVVNLDWPSVTARGTNPLPQKTELISIFEQLKSAGITCVVFQVRPECDALYASPYEPWSYWLTGGQGVGPATAFDPLEFAVTEAHNRGMELHAWFNPYRAERTTGSYTTAANHVTKAHPDWIMTFGTLKMLDPGLPAVREHDARVIADVVRRYDVDGIHMDDYFYPYTPKITVQDSASWRMYPRGFTNIDNWRRDNVNLLIGMIRDSALAIKPHVKFGMSPFGIWKNGTPPGITGMSSYSDIFCDPIDWLQQGTIDYLTPQLYWQIGGPQDYQKLSAWWADSVAAHNRHFYPGQASYRINDNNWAATELPNQIKINRANPKTGGSVFFRAGQGVTNNPKGFADSLINNYYRYPALHPVMAWKDNVKPYPVRNIRYAPLPGSGQTAIQWDLPLQAPDGNTASRFAVYRFDHYPAQADFDDARNLLSVEGNQYFVPPPGYNPQGSYFYVVNSLDRNYNEGDTSNVLLIATPAAPVLSGPPNGTTDAPGSPKLTWRWAAGIGSYHLQVSTDTTFSGTLTLDDANVLDTAKTVSGLAGQTVYHWRVRATNAGGTGPWSATWNFRTATPMSVLLLYPGPGTVDVPVNLTLRWQRAFAANAYQVQVSTNSVFSSLVLDTSHVADTTVGLTGLQSLRNHYWRVRGENAAGVGAWSATNGFRTVQVVSVEAEEEVPTEYQLSQNFPNPFNPTTAISFSVPRGGRVTLRVFDLLGREEATLVDQEMPAGTFTVTWNATSVASGVYFYRMTAGDFVGTRRMVLVR